MEIAQIYALNNFSPLYSPCIVPTGSKTMDCSHTGLLLAGYKTTQAVFWPWTAKGNFLLSPIVIKFSKTLLNWADSILNWFTPLQVTHKLLPNIIKIYCLFLIDEQLQESGALQRIWPNISKTVEITFIFKIIFSLYSSHIPECKLQWGNVFNG